MGYLYPDGRSGTLSSGGPGSIPSDHLEALAPSVVCNGELKEPTWTYLEVRALDMARTLLCQATIIAPQLLWALLSCLRELTVSAFQLHLKLL